MEKCSTKLNSDDFMLFILLSLDPNQCVCCFLVAERYMLPIISDEVYEYAVSTVGTMLFYACRYKQLKLSNSDHTIIIKETATLKVQ